MMSECGRCPLCQTLHLKACAPPDVWSFRGEADNQTELLLVLPYSLPYGDAHSLTSQARREHLQQIFAVAHFSVQKSSAICTLFHYHHHILGKRFWLKFNVAKYFKLSS